MSTEIIKNVLTKTGKTLGKNSPTILTVLALSGLVTTIGLAIKATHEYDQQFSDKTKSNAETAKAIVKCYLPTFISGALTISSILGAHTVNAKRNLAFLGAYKLSEDKLKTYQTKIFDKVSDKNKKSVSNNTIIFGDGSIDCYDEMSGRYFKTSMSTLDNAMHQVNKMIFGDEGVSINEFYELVGIDSIDLGDNIEWRQRDGLVELQLGSNLLDNGKLVMTIDFDPRPDSTNYN